MVEHFVWAFLYPTLSQVTTGLVGKISEGAEAAKEKMGEVANGAKKRALEAGHLTCRAAAGCSSVPFGRGSKG